MFKNFLRFFIILAYLINTMIFLLSCFKIDESWILISCVFYIYLLTCFKVYEKN
jgi:hypothetical protein